MRIYNTKMFLVIMVTKCVAIAYWPGPKVDAKYNEEYVLVIY